MKSAAFVLTVYDAPVAIGLRTSASSGTTVTSGRMPIFTTTTGDEFEVKLGSEHGIETDHALLESDMYRYRASSGYKRIPGSVDARSAQ